MRKGWEIKKLGDVCEFQNGFAFKSNKYKDTGLPVLRITNIQNENLETNKIVFFEPRDYKENFEKYKVEYGDLVIAMSGATTGKIGINQTDTVFYLNQRVGKFIPKKNILKTYLFYFLSTNVEESLRISAGAAQPNLSTEQIKNFKISIPPLPEQKEIVSILDNAFESIESAKSNAEQNLKNAKELFESYLNDIFESKDKEWVIEPFEKVCNLVGGSQPSKDNFIYEPRNGYIRLIQVRDYRTSKFITYIPKEKARRFCSENDIMIGRYGPPIFGIFKGLEGAYNVALMKAEVNNKLCDSEYFYWFLKTNKLRQFVEKSSKRAAGQDGIRKELLDKYPVPFPKSIEKQKSIVRNIELLINETKRLESIYQQKLNDLEDLKKSILQKAFNGELKTSKISA